MNNQFKADNYCLPTIVYPSLLSFKHTNKEKKSMRGAKRAIFNGDT